MKKSMFIYAAMLLLAIPCSAQNKNSNPVLQIEGGRVQGVVCDSSQVITYKGIPYAAPPVGALRWKKPQRVIPWRGVKKADTFSAASVQNGHSPNEFYAKEFYWKGDPQFSEDCLYLNVWTPASAASKPKAKMPVAMWIHGGAYLGGWGHEVTMDGNAWAKKGVILVTINYRLGLLGFMAHPLLSAESKDGTSGNYGLYDQIAALKWVKNNIAQFGGDPDNITVFGQSAGAASVRNLVTSPLSRHLVSKAIIQSGGGLSDLVKTSTTDMAAIGQKITDIAGLKTLKQMRAATPAQLSKAAMTYLSQVHQFLVFTPYQDGKVLTEGFDASIYDKSIADIPYMIGYTQNDIADMRTSIERFCTVRDSLSNKPTYMYLFARPLPGDNSGAFHSAELWYVFHTLSRSWRPFTAADYKLSDEIVTYWTNFAKTGNPNDSGTEPWKRYTSKAPFVKTLQIK